MYYYLSVFRQPEKRKTDREHQKTRNCRTRFVMTLHGFITICHDTLHGSSDCPEVASALALSKKDRVIAMKKITNKGIFKHYGEVVRNHRGTFIPARCPRQRCSIGDYRPCPYGFISVEKELWRPYASCPHKPANTKNQMMMQ